MQVIGAATNNQVLFAQLRKVDEENRLIYGRATSEAVDRSGEVCDYETSKPFFQKWSDEMKALTNGASLGNVRSMHGKIAAGKLVEIIFDDIQKCIDIVAKVVDDNEWTKVLEGVYTGFSIGGSYGKRWDDPVMKIGGVTPAKRYTAIPNEVSLVDRGCNPDALFFEVRKVDGSMQTVGFQAQHEAELDEQNFTKGTEMKTRAEKEAALIAAGANADDLAKMDDAGIDAKFAEVGDGGASADAGGAAGEGDLGKAADAEQEGELLVVGTDEEVVELIALMNKHDMTVAQAIAALSKSLEVPDATPLAKGLYTVGSLAELVMRLNSMLEGVKYEESQEKDGSDIGARLAAAVGTLGDILVDMVAEEVSELKGEERPANVMALSDAVGGLVKLADEKLDAMLKAGARNSAADLARIQKMHDHAVELGAACAAEKADAGAMQKMDGDVMQKAIDAAIAPLSKSLSDALEKISVMEKMVPTATISLRAVAKADESAALGGSAGEVKFEPVLKGDGSVDEVATAIKKAQQTGGVALHKL